MRAGPNNSLADIAGITVGNAQDTALKSGVTAVIFSEPCIASASVLSGAPGTRETDLLQPENSVEEIDALVLSGGSAFGLDAASGVQSWLRENGRGFAVGPVRVPIVPAAILFDLINGGDKNWGRFGPYRDLGWQAAETASSTFATGSQGAGAGAIVAGLKGGLGTASMIMENGITIAALFAVNALGNPLFQDTPNFHASPFELDGEFGGLGLPDALSGPLTRPLVKFRAEQSAGQNTTIGIVATDAVLTKAQAKRLANAAHDGIARAIWPAHTPMDGDLVFAAATGKSGLALQADQWIDMAAHAASVTARAIARGIFDASEEQGDLFPTYSGKFGK